MKLSNLLALLLFLSGVVWVFTLKESSVRNIQRAYYGVITPFVSAGSSIGQKAKNFTQEYDHSRLLTAKLSKAEEELGRLRINQARLRELEEQNAKLAAALEFKQQTKFDASPARVIRRLPSTWWQTVIINRGDDAGVGVQVPVLSDQGLVGKVDQPREGTSTVILLTDEKCQVAAKIEGSNEVGILSGQRGQFEGNPPLRLRYLSKDAAIKPGMKVFTSGSGGLFPPNILLGTIEKFESNAYDAEAQVTPAVDFANLDIVFVLTNVKG